MGMSEFYGSADEARGDGDDPAGARAGRRPSSTRPTCTGRSPTRSSSARRSPATATRSCWRPSSATCAAQNGERLGVRGDPEYVREACEASLQPARGRDDRPLLPAPRRSEGADRGDRRRDGRAGRAGQGAPPRTLRGGAGDDPPRPRRPTRSPRCRPSTRSGAATPRTRSCRPCASSASASSPTARSAAASSPAASAPSRTCPRTTSAASTPASKARTSSATWSWSRRVEEIAAEKGITAGQLALAWVLAQGDDLVADPGDQAPELPGGERGRRRGGAERGGPASDRRGRAAGRRRRRPLRRYVAGQPLSHR